MFNQEISQATFAELAGSLLKDGYSVVFKACGWSMSPFIRNGDVITVSPFSPETLLVGDVVLYLRDNGSAVAHRVLSKSAPESASVLLVRGDALTGACEEIPLDRILGKIVKTCRNTGTPDIASPIRRLTGIVWARLQPIPFTLIRLAHKLRMAVRRSTSKAQ